MSGKEISEEEFNQLADEEEELIQQVDWNSEYYLIEFVEKHQSDKYLE